MSPNFSSTGYTAFSATDHTQLEWALFTLYTNDCIRPSLIATNVKCSDDTAILALLNGSIIGYQDTNSHFTQWHMDNYPQLNVIKTKELVINTPSTHSTVYNSTHNPTCINNETVEMVECFKYLGVTLDNKLSFEQHTTDIRKRCQQRLSAIHKLKALSVAPPPFVAALQTYCPTHSPLLFPLFLHHVNCHQ